MHLVGLIGPGMRAAAFNVKLEDGMAATTLRVEIGRPYVAMRLPCCDQRQHVIHGHHHLLLHNIYHRGMGNGPSVDHILIHMLRKALHP